MRKKWIVLLIFSAFMMSSCDLITDLGSVYVKVIEKSKTVEEEDISNLDENNPGVIEILPGGIQAPEDRQWTILVYMSGDNKLEAAALEDLYEMQKSKINTSRVTLLVLLDRHNGYNSSNGDWTGTKLFRVSTGNSDETNFIVSEEIDCVPLGLVAGEDVELEMASIYTLGGVLNYVMGKFPAEKYGLIMWGHGTGWRSGDINENCISDIGESDKSIFKGFAYDETSGTYMSLKQLGVSLGTALGNHKLNFVGFDTCFGGEIEVAYEMRNFAEFLVGSEGLVSSFGWDYKSCFDKFADSDELTEERLCEVIVDSFSAQYKNTSEASICAVRLSEIESYVDAFDVFCAAVGESIKNVTIRDEVMNLVYADKECKTKRFTYGAAGYDVYLDVTSMSENLASYFTLISLKNLKAELSEVEENLYIKRWNLIENEGGLGVFFAALGPGGVLSAVHPAAYVSEQTVNQIDFVRDCKSYVPNSVTGMGFLDSLFYRSLN